MLRVLTKHLTRTHCIKMTIQMDLGHDKVPSVRGHGRCKLEA